MPIIIQSGSKQYTVNKGQKIILDRLNAEVGDTVNLDLVYSYGEDKINDKTVKATVVSHQKGKKIRILKYKAKSNYKRSYGYRHYETIVEIAA
jgi:large subunit ribosomal protein L21